MVASEAEETMEAPASPNAPIDAAARRRARFQFNLRSLLIATALLSAAMGLAMWKGIGWGVGFLIATDVLLILWALAFRRWRRAVGWGLCLLLLLSGPALYGFGPRTERLDYCWICGRYKAEATILGWKWYDRERESRLSEWYRDVGLDAHSHEWRFVCSNEQEWGGGVGCYDSLGCDLTALDRLKEVHSKTDEGTFRELAALYLATRRDRSRFAEFWQRCDKIDPPKPEGPPEPGSP
jgi:hypothetical protein